MRNAREHVEQTGVGASTSGPSVLSCAESASFGGANDVHGSPTALPCIGATLAIQPGSLEQAFWREAAPQLMLLDKVAAALMGCAGLLALKPAGGATEQRGCAITWIMLSWGQLALMQQAPVCWGRFRALLLGAAHVLRTMMCQPPLLQAAPAASAMRSLRCAGSTAWQAPSCSSAALLATNVLNALLYVTLHQQPVMQQVPVLLLCVSFSLVRFTDEALELLHGTGCETPWAALRMFADRAMLMMLSGPAPALQHIGPEHLQPAEEEDVLLAPWLFLATLGGFALPLYVAWHLEWRAKLRFLLRNHCPTEREQLAVLTPAVVTVFGWPPLGVLTHVVCLFMIMLMLWAVTSAAATLWQQ